MDKAQQLADAHWNYIQQLLTVHTEGDNAVFTKEIATIGFHYKTAFIHGYKHGIEDNHI